MKNTLEIKKKHKSRQWKVELFLTRERGLNSWSASAEIFKFWNIEYENGCWGSYEEVLKRIDIDGYNDPQLAIRSLEEQIAFYIEEDDKEET